MNEHAPAPRGLLPAWADGARRVSIVRAGREGFDAILADDAARRGVGWSGATPADVPEAVEAVFFTLDVEAMHGFFARDAPFDLDLVQVDEDGVVLGVHRMVAGAHELIYPPSPIRYALELPAGGAARLGLAVDERLGFDSEEVAPAPSERLREPPVELDPRDDPALVERWCLREHLYASPRFAAGAALMGWRLVAAPGGLALWMNWGGVFAIQPRVVELGPLNALARTLGLAWVRLELPPRVLIVSPEGRETLETFDPRDPADWLARMRRHHLYPTDGRWHFSRSMLLDLGGDEATMLARIPPRVRNKVHAFMKALEAGRYRVEVVPGARFDERQERAITAMRSDWFAAHPEVADNMQFCMPLAGAYQDALCAYLCWQDTELLAVQMHTLWQGTLFYTFAEARPTVPHGLTTGLTWFGVRRAKATPFGPSGPPDLLDFAGAFDPRYPSMRPYWRTFTSWKERWHGTNVWLPPTVALAHSEMP